MGLFQQSVLKKYLKDADQAVMKPAFEKLATYFQNRVIQQNICDCKEEEYQDGFLTALFVNVFGYTLKPNPDFNLTREFKNEKGARKADGAILKDGTAIGVIELKSTTTKDLESIRLQAFDYKANQKNCVFVITSNFEKVRFYINNAVDFEEFDLFRLNYEQFQIMWLCLAKENLLKGTPLAIKNESVVKEEDITRKIYVDYTAFKHDLYNDLIQNNLHLSIFESKEEKEIKLTLFKKSQKLLDRFLFILFGEDRGLLPPNSISEILKQWEQLKELDEYKPLYTRYKKYFGYLNEGWKGKKHEIFAYNGGLFLPDKVLDAVTISDDILYKHTKILTGYDFESEVDVNILGHIFENSLSEIEEVAAQIEGSQVDLKKSKRKKDGVFYTPKYITKYIVENTVGKLCSEKKAELGLLDFDYDKDFKLTTWRTIESTTEVKVKNEIRQIIEKRRTNISVEGTKQLDILNNYRNWLLTLTICDPACGSGAFLNQALDFLFAEHKTITELTQKITGDISSMFVDIENQILENNIYGVDINDESVEIARLSLWLRTAKKGRKLTTLSNNIKCGNSLIDDSAVAGEKAFHWPSEFPEVFAKGGFDVVIGNPPYMRVQGLRDNFEKETKLYETIYKSATGRFDIYVLFVERALGLINNSGKISFILPHKFMVSDFGEGIRNFLLENKAVEKIVHFGAEMVFADASTYTCILCLSNNNNLIKFKQIKPLELLIEHQFEEINYEIIDNNKWNLQNTTENKLFEKLKRQPHTVKSVFENISQGVVSVGDEIFLMKGEIKGDKFIGYSDKIGETIIIEAETVKPILKGEDVKKYAPLKNTYFCLYPHIKKDGKTIPYEEEFFKEKYPLAYNYILPFKDELIEKKIRYKTNPKAWYSLHRSREISLFEQEKIVTPETSLGGNMTIDLRGFYHNTQVYTLEKKFSVKEDIKFWLAILNSSLFWYFLQHTGAILRGGYFRFKTKYLEPFPLPKLDDIEKQNPIIEKVNLIISKTADFQNILFQFIQLLQNKFEIEKPTTKLQNWHDIGFKDFLYELQKAKVKLTLSEEAEWMAYFNEQKQKSQTLKTEIDKTDHEIDRMVYELYGLTEEEIGIVEGNY